MCFTLRNNDLLRYKAIWLQFAIDVEIFAVVN